jgi:quinol monooxygenase YgiN
MNERHSFHFLKISGDISDNKEKEFEQTIRFVFNQLPDECIDRSLTQDTFNAGHYVFYSVWHNERALLKFMKSEEYDLIKGAFETLGFYENTVKGEIE